MAMQSLCLFMIHCILVHQINPATALSRFHLAVESRWTSFAYVIPDKIVISLHFKRIFTKRNNLQKLLQLQVWFNISCNEKESKPPHDRENMLDPKISMFHNRRRTNRLRGCRAVV